MTKPEKNDALLGIEELQRSGFIRDDPEQDGRNFKILTDRGWKYAEKDLANIMLPSVNIEEVLSNDDLLDIVRDDYVNGKYDNAIKNAFQMVEEQVRKKAGLPASTTGHDVMVGAFSPGKGILKHQDAQAPGEHQALYLLFDGSNGWFRNPTHHRTVGYSDPQEAAQILGLANILLNLLSKCA